ncbi:MAG: tetratricopeptide repeat protein [Nitrospirae bacterium]|nr:tetratricopeptide repeat protein [Nitrospirota bacterium]
MGQVWRGIHRVQEVPVALKVITAKAARDRKYLDAFQNEVQAVATLDHPGIVTVFDVNRVTPEAEEKSQGQLVTGSPVLAMELASLGSLNERTVLSWDDLRRTLQVLLEALAHAHARGVIHRDLKPGNILVCGDGDPRPGLKLSDFGLAHAVERQEREGSRERVMGTPYYMAPEQVRGHWRDYGPWTDLFSLGCVAYALASGAPPFKRRNPKAVMEAQLHESPPPLVARMPLPAGFEGWLLRLVEKDPGARFQRAADAAYALERLGDAEAKGTGGSEAGRQVRGAEAEAADEESTSLVTEEHTATLDGPEVPAPETGEVSPGGTRLCARAVPPLPHEWHEPPSRARSMRFVGAGLGLYGLRAIPVVGRARERDAMWQALAAVRTTGTARVVVLRGAAGNGKSRLVEWMTQRAHEVGSAQVVRGTHSPIGGPAEGLPRMVARLLGCIGLNRAEVAERAERILRGQGVTSPYEWNALAELVAPAPEDASGGGAIVRFASPTERYVLVRRLLEREARHRPVILWLDDVQWGSDAVAFVEHLVAAQDLTPTPVLVLLTLQEEALAERPVEAAQLGELLRLPAVSALSVPALSRAERAQLVEQLLGLEGELAAHVEERSAGNPLFAVQLVGDWVERGVLEVGPTGFILRPGEKAILPDTIHEVWRARVRKLLEGQGGGGEEALEIAAAVALEVDAHEWAEACTQAGVAPPDGLVPALVGARLAGRTEAGWAFAHGMLRESLERMAREAGRWEKHNLACAAMLRRRFPGRQRGIPERLGRHLTEAGRFEEALQPLWDGAEDRRAASDYRQAHALLSERDHLLETLMIPPTDERWGAGWILRCQISRLQGQYDAAQRWAERARTEAEQSGWASILPRSLRELGEVAQRKGDLTTAVSLFTQALRLHQASANEAGSADCLQGLAQAALRHGHHDRSLELLRNALSLREKLSDVYGMAQCLFGMGNVAQQLGQLREAGDYFRRSLPLNESIGNQFGVGQCVNGLAEVDRFLGNLEEAEAGYRRALLIYEAIGSEVALFPRLNLGLVLVARGNHSEAREVLQAGARILERSGRRGLLGCVHAELLPSTAALGDWVAWDRHYAAASAILAETGEVDVDVAWPAQLAGDVAAKGGDTRRALLAYRLALRQWKALKNPEKVGEVMAAMERIGKEEGKGPLRT